jgi:hypothetical protein
MLTVRDTAEKRDMFNYLKMYLLYENAARANNSFSNFTREEVSTYSDIIEPQDYGLRLGLLWS